MVVGRHRDSTPQVTNPGFTPIVPDMPETANPPLDRFLSRLPDRLVWGQVLIRLENHGPGRTLRHVADEGVEASALREVGPGDVRRLAETSADGGFRPLKSTPDLVRGWWCRVPTGALLGAALEDLYPVAAERRADGTVILSGSSPPK